MAAAVFRVCDGDVLISKISQKVVKSIFRQNKNPHEPGVHAGFFGGRKRTRTADLLRVKHIFMCFPLLCVVKKWLK